MSSIFTHPEVVQLRQKHAELTERLAAVLEEIRVLTHEINPHIMRKYDELFRTEVAEIQKKTLEASEFSRRVELFTIKLERGEPLTTKVINLVNTIVEKEFAKTRQRIRDTFNKTADQREQEKRQRHQALTAEELPKMYRSIVKKLHPDSAEAHHPLYEKYWQQVQDAYEQKDLARLQSYFSVIVGASIHSSEDTLAPERLREDIQKLTARVAYEEKKLAEMRTSEPFSLREKIEDEAWINDSRQKLSYEIALLEKKINHDKSWLQEYVGLHWREGIAEPEKTITSTVDEDFMEASYFSGFR